MSIEAILEGLNEEQRVAATSIDGAIRLIAGAGSGKTHTLTRRVAYICEKTGTPPDRILSLTFTNKAAAEMRSRVAKQLNVSEEMLNMTTFHSLAYEIVKENKRRFGWNSIAVAEMNASMLTALFLSRNKGILDSLSPDEQTQVKQCIKNEVDYALKKGYYASWLANSNKVDLAPVQDVLKEVTYIDQNNETRTQYKKNVKAMKDGKLAKKYTPQMVEDQWKQYTKIDTFLKDMKQKGITPVNSWVRNIIRQKQGKCSFDDMLTLAVYLLETYPEIREKWSSKFDYIQVDEFQDTDSKQLELVKLLYEPHGNLFVVGDPDQSIYLFRGAEPTLFNKLEEHIPNLKTIFMVYNYRSTDEIVNISDEVITLNKNRINKQCKSKKGTGNKVCVLMEKTAQVLIDKEFEIIQKEIANGRPLEDIAILFRKNSNVLKQGLLKKCREANIPCAVSEEVSRYIKFAEALCKYKYKAREEYIVAAMNVFNSAPFTFYGLQGIYNPYRFAKVELNVQAIKQAYTDMIMDMSKVEFGKRPDTIQNKINTYLSQSEMEKLEAETQQVLDKWSALSDAEKDDICNNASELLETTDVADTTGKLQFVTMHKAKGLEWPVVFVNGLCADDMVMPGDGFAEQEEYARLAYVSYSRAKEQLYIGYVGQAQTKQKDGNIVSVDSVMSGVLARVASDKLNYVGDKETIQKLPQYKQVGTNIYKEQLMNSFEPYYTPLVMQDKIIGYRYTMNVEGEVRAFQATIEDLERLKCVPDNKYVYIIKITKPLEIRKIQNGHMFAFDEMVKTLKVYDCKTDDEVIAVFKGGSGEKFGLDTKDVVMLTALLDKAEYKQVEKEADKPVEKPVKADKVVKPVAPVKSEAKPVKIAYQRVIDRATGKDVGIRLYRGTEHKDIKIPYAEYIKQNDLSGCEYKGELRVWSTQKINKTYTEMQQINEAVCKHIRSGPNANTLVYRIEQVNTEKDEVLVKSQKENTQPIVMNIYELMQYVQAGRCYITNISKLCNWRGFIREGK